MPNTMPEGFTPPPQLMETPRPQNNRSYLHAVSIVVGIILGLGAIFGATGRLLYVERSEWAAKREQDAQDKVTVSKGIENIGSRLDQQNVVLDRFGSSMDRLATDLQALKVEVARRLR